MRLRRTLPILLLVIPLLGAALPAAEMVSFPSGSLTLHGVLYRPAGAGPFPAVVFNHGSIADPTPASDALGPVFAKHGWVFFMPYRRGHGPSASAGPYIRDEITAAVDQGGIPAGAAVMVHRLETDQLDDQLAALAWLRKRDFVKSRRVAAAGNSFGGIETVLGVEKADYCAGIDSAGGAESWAQAPELQKVMTRAVRNARAPIFFFQAENDYDLTPSRTLAAAMKKAGRPFEIKIYPRFGDSDADGHTFAYFGSEVWAGHVFRFLRKYCGA
jgi:carboxymethylenebutenolidase